MLEAGAAISNPRGRSGAPAQPSARGSIDTNPTGLIAACEPTGCRLISRPDLPVRPDPGPYPRSGPDLDSSHLFRCDDISTLPRSDCLSSSHNFCCRSDELSTLPSERSRASGALPKPRYIRISSRWRRKASAPRRSKSDPSHSRRFPAVRPNAPGPRLFPNWSGYGLFPGIRPNAPGSRLFRSPVRTRSGRPGWRRADRRPA